VQLGEVPQTFGIAAPQTWLAPPQDVGPQLMTVPQPSVANPQLNPCCAQVRGMHGGVPHTFGIVTPQACPVVHVPQSSVPPQPFAAMPQLKPSDGQVLAVQPHTFIVPPPPHVSGALQPPHDTIVLQLFATITHLPEQVVAMGSAMHMHVRGMPTQDCEG
jgi:hypothetical protein